MGFSDRARLFWRRAGARGEKLASSGKERQGHVAQEVPRVRTERTWPASGCGPRNYWHCGGMQSHQTEAPALAPG